MDNTNPAVVNLAKMIENKYQVAVVDAQYVKVDEKYDRYNMMFEIKMPEAMLKAFKRKYFGKDHAMQVVWSIYDGKVRFNAEIGNNILLLLDSVVEENK